MNNENDITTNFDYIKGFSSFSQLIDGTLAINFGKFHKIHWFYCSQNGNHQQKLQEEAPGSVKQHSVLGFSRPVIDIEALEEKFQEKHKAAKDSLYRIKSKLNQTVLQNVSKDSFKKKVQWRLDTANLDRDSDYEVLLIKDKSEKEHTMMGHRER